MCGLPWSMASFHSSKAWLNMQSKPLLKYQCQCIHSMVECNLAMDWFRPSPFPYESWIGFSTPHGSTKLKASIDFGRMANHHSLESLTLSSSHPTCAVLLFKLFLICLFLQICQYQLCPLLLCQTITSKWTKISQTFFINLA